MYEPVIKWSGSKRSQAAQIIDLFPKEIETYYEPFCGGASVLRRLLESDIQVKNYVCSDINNDLISLWNVIKTNPCLVSQHYEQLWNELNKDTDFERKKNYYNTIRDRYNRSHNPLDFMFIMRTTTNGMPRYNNRGEFNNSFHITRNGIQPRVLSKILSEWSLLLNNKNVQFKCMDYKIISPSNKDIVYLDPPYANTKGMYMGGIDLDTFFTWLKTIPCNYFLSFDGKSGTVDNTYAIPNELYTQHIYLSSGNSAFKRVVGKSKDSVVYESLYIKEVE